MRRAITILLLGVLLLPGRVLHSQELSVEESQVKAAFLYNFTQFVSWEGAPSRDTTVGFKIGIYGDNSIGQALADAVAGEKVGTLAIRVVSSTDLGRLDSCQMVFVSKCDENLLRTIVNALGPEGVLLVGEQDGFAQLGGSIEFVVEGNRVKFIINKASIRRANLSCSSKLERVAKRVLD